jgi:hypothetical protein
MPILRSQLWCALVDLVTTQWSQHVAVIVTVLPPGRSSNCCYTLLEIPERAPKKNKETELLQFVPHKTQRNTQLHKWDGAPHSTACRSWTNSSNSPNPSCLVHTWRLFCCTKLWNINESLTSMTLQDQGCMHWVLESIPPANTVHPSSEQLFKTLVKAGQSPGIGSW